MMCLLQVVRLYYYRFVIPIYHIPLVYFRIPGENEKCDT